MVCIGETAEDLEAHGPSAVPSGAARTALGGVAMGSKELSIVAYEPVWVIGSGQAATTEQAAAAVRPRGALAEVLGDECPRRRASSTEASVKAGNIAAFLLRAPNVDGALVGGASLQHRRVLEHRPLQKHVGACTEPPTARSRVRLYSIVGTETLRRARKGSPWIFVSRSSCRYCSVSRASADPARPAAQGRGGGPSDMFGGGVDL